LRDAPPMEFKYIYGIGRDLLCQWQIKTKVTSVHSTDLKAKGRSTKINPHPRFQDQYLTW
jgi:hypothetical protein